MITENSELMRSAREALKGKWGLAIGTWLVYTVIYTAIGIIPFVGQFVDILILTGPFGLGVAIFFLTIARNQETHLNYIFRGFDRFKVAFIANILICVFTLLWTLLLIVPGIIAGLSYAMTYFILADDEYISAKEALEKSKIIMYGYKSKLFWLGMRIMGVPFLILTILMVVGRAFRIPPVNSGLIIIWGLALLVLLIAIIFLLPYMQVSYAKFYDDIKDNPIAREEKIN